MVSSFTLNTDELNAGFLEIIKKLFAGKEIEITVQDVQNDTSYLLKNTANKTHLLQSIASLENNQQLHVLSEHDL
jgi:antitoxin (DNA-binding transcriptional repressor) of toxin-antitoxin stability system